MFDVALAAGENQALLVGSGSSLSTLSGAQSLAQLPRGVSATVVSVLAPEFQEDRELVLRLIEIGFVPGEAVRVVAHGMPGHEPIAVRLGATTFALRRFEADYIQVVADPPSGAS
jgi:ferrous iron transport protein A